MGFTYNKSRTRRTEVWFGGMYTSFEDCYENWFVNAERKYKDSTWREVRLKRFGNPFRSEKEAR